MLFNLQWDDVNSRRFGFSAAGAPITVLHGTLSGALAKVLPAIIGRGLSGLAPRIIPVAVAPVQVMVFPVSAAHVAAAHTVVSELADRGLRATAGTNVGTLASRIRASRDEWTPYHGVVGDDEASGEPVRLRSPARRGDISAQELLDELATSQTQAARLARLDTPFSR